MKIRIAFLVLVVLFGCAQPVKKEAEQQKLPLLKISENKRFLSDEDGNPFFWLGDTGWLLFSKLDREKSIKY